MAASVPPGVSLQELERLGDALTRPAPAKRMLVVVNPYATTVSDRLKSLVVYALRGRYEVEAVETEARGHATELAREAALEGYDVVVAFGGDGTINEVANGLAGSDTPLSCLPGGATNVYPRMLGIPDDIVDATEHLLRVADEWRPRRLDVGTLNDRAFVFSSGMGLDASVVRDVDRHPYRKAKFGAWYFATRAIGTFTRRYLFEQPRIDVTCNGRQITGVTVIVQNGMPFTYFNERPIHIAESVALDGGTLGAAVLTRANPLDMPTVIWRVLARGPQMAKHRRVEVFNEVEELRAVAQDGRPIPVQVDGDYIGDVAEVVYGVRPGALVVVA
jgi:diacylglycerol kinase family enzyme